MIIMCPSQVDPDDTATECPGGGISWTATPEYRRATLLQSAAHLTPRQVAELLAITQTCWSRIVNGGRPSAEVARRIEAELTLYSW